LAVADSEVRLFGKPQALVNRRMGVALASADSVAAAREKAVSAARAITLVNG
jgi:phosphoribosylglycinamide formyltransferase 2